MNEMETIFDHRGRATRRMEAAFSNTPAMIEAHRLERIEAAIDALNAPPQREDAPEAQSPDNAAPGVLEALQSARSAIRSDANATGDGLNAAPDFSRIIRDAVSQKRRAAR